MNCCGVGMLAVGAAVAVRADLDVSGLRRFDCAWGSESGKAGSAS